MDKKELERRLEAAEKQFIGLQDEIANLKAKLDEMQDEPEIPDFPEFAGNETYWYVGSDLNDTVVGRAVGTYADDYNVFHTKEYADEFAKKCKLIAMMLHCKWYICCGYKPDFNNGYSKKWSVVFNYHEGKFTVEFSRMREWSTIYFDTEENAQKCADWINKHWKEDGNDT